MIPALPNRSGLDRPIHRVGESMRKPSWPASTGFAGFNKTINSGLSLYDAQRSFAERRHLYALASRPPAGIF